METIPPMYWMIVVGVLAALLAYILFYIGVLVKETVGIVTSVKNTVTEVNDAVAGPVRAIKKVTSAVDGFVSGLVPESSKESKSKE